MPRPDGYQPKMTMTTQMLDTYPADLGTVDIDLMARCIEACLDCEQACTACADACLSEPMVQDLIKCIRTNLDTADIASATGKILSRHTGYDANLTRTVLEACMMACRACADECDRHGQHMEHCRVCAEACRECEAACRELLATI
jgi:hypothetical protein